MCAIIVPVANTLIWRQEDTRSTFKSLRDLAVLLPLLLLIFLAASSPDAFVLDPIAIFSSFGLVMALTLVNVVFVLGLTNQVGRFASWRQLFPFLSVGVILAVIELTALFSLKTAALQFIAQH